MDEETLLSIYDAYSTGVMSPEEKIEYEIDVKAGAIQLPQGKILQEVQQTQAIALPSGVLDAYFSGQMTPEEQQEFEQDAGKGLIQLPEGIKVTSFHSGGIPGQPTIGYKLEKEPGFKEVLTGAGEAALSLATGATTGGVGFVGGATKELGKQILSGEFGTPQAARAVEEAAIGGAQALTYAPRTQTGQQYTQAVAETIAPLEALAPIGAEMEAITRSVQASKATPRVKTRAIEAIRAAEEAGITPVTTDIFPPKTFVGKFAQAAGERIPVVGTGDVRAAQQVERTGAIRNILREYGATDAAQASDDVMRSLLEKRSDDVNKYATSKKEVIEKLTPSGEVPVSKTILTIEDEITKLKSLKTKGATPAITLLEDYKNSLQGQNLTNIELLRKQLGEELKAPDMASVRSTTEQSVGSIYKSLRDDMGKFIKENGQRNDFNKWMVANRRLSDMMGDLKNTTLKSTLAKGEATPELVKRMLFSQKPSDIKTLFKNLPPEGRANARTAILQEAVTKSGGVDDFSPAKFETQLKKLSKSTGVFFTGDDKKALNGLSKALDITKRGGIAGVKPTTGAELTTLATPTALTWFLGSDPVTGLAATGAVGLMARIYESKPVRNLLVKISNAPKGKELPLVTSLMAEIKSQQEKEE